MTDDYGTFPPESYEPLSVAELAALLPQYEVLELHARGGMGAVYRARQPNLDRCVAIKLLWPQWGEQEGFTERFQIEARSMAKLSHSNIVAVHDFGITEGSYHYIVMEWVEGATLHQLIEAGTVTPAQAGTVALQLCDALQYAHSQGVIHRDIKPANILVDHVGRVKVADFGLARPAHDGSMENRFGTPGYAAPEISHEGAKVDHRADVYAVGAVVHEMLSGHVPTMPRALVAGPGVPPDWDIFIDRAMNPSPGGRFNSAAEMRSQIVFITGAKARAPAGNAQLHHVPAKSAGNPVLLWGAALVLLLGGGVLLWFKMSKGASPVPVVQTVAPARNSTDAVPLVTTPAPVVPPVVAVSTPDPTPESPPPPKPEVKPMSQTETPVPPSGASGGSGSRSELVTLEQSDPELFALATRMLNDWEVNAEVHSDKAMAELNEKYFGAVRRVLPGSAVEREAFLTEISRLANQQDLDVLTDKSPAALKTLRQTYDGQRDAVQARVEAAATAARESHRQRLDELAAKRKSDANMAGEARVRAFAALFTTGTEPPTIELIKQRAAMPERSITSAPTAEPMETPVSLTRMPTPLGPKAAPAGFRAPPMTGRAILHRPEKSGKVVAWVQSTSYQPSSTTMVPTGIRAVDVAASRDHALAVTSEGTVVAWGLMENAPATVPQGLDHVVQVGAGSRYSAALREDGSIVEWNSRDLLPVEDATLSVALHTEPYVSFGYARHADGSLHVIGSKSSTWARPPAGLRDVVQLGFGSSLVVAVNRNGSITSWNTTTSSKVLAALLPVPDPGRHVVTHVSVGTESMLLWDKGIAFEWGDGSPSKRVNGQKFHDVETVRDALGGFIFKLSRNRWLFRLSRSDVGGMDEVKMENLTKGCLDVEPSGATIIAIKP